MKLHEYQSKQIFSKHGIPIPRGKVASSLEEVGQISNSLGGRVVIKSQVLVGGRGKAGGVRLSKSNEESVDLASQILGMQIKGFPVRKVLVEEAVSISQEIYLGIANDRNLQKPVLMASSSGGVDIEEIALKSPEKIIKRTIDPLLGLRDYQLRDIAISIDLDRSFWDEFGDVINGLWKVYVECDATLVEINPLVVTSDNRLLALDAKINLDDNALFRHPNLEELRDPDAEDPLEREG
jgi:succinyl-CoA synthetase beta subunit